jgi:uncharacterized membrane protein (UPF0136 family)
MTAFSLIIAVTVGLVIGVAGRLVACRGRSAPWWLPVSAAVAAAVLATVAVRMANTDHTAPTLLEVALQLLFAVVGVAVVAATADRIPAASWEHGGGKAR